MGEVWRARDTKLEREVAIKTLPSSFADDPDRLARFEREAKLLASLNHANIAAIHGLDEHDGTHYLAMELVEGETLDEKLKGGPVPVEEALRIALQIAHALEAAHANGVVHRDLKPANIMITPNDQVKVLDFGLAKAFSGNPSEASPAHSPALSVAMTQAGLILGTAGYMSPEQASGQATDQRADVWSFGVVLYEMLTGLPLFSGESVPHVLAAVLQTEPDWSRLPNDLHPRIRSVLERCLRKKARMRYHAIADVRVDIEEILADPAGLTARPGSGESAPAKASRSRLAAAVALTAVVAVLATAFVTRWLGSEPEAGPRPINRFSFFLPDGTTTRLQGESVVAVSPDGRNIVVNTADGLYLRPLDQLEGRLLPGTEENLSLPFFSPDGQQVGYYAEVESKLKRVRISGGAPVVVANIVRDGTNLGAIVGADWADDGAILLVVDEGLVRVPDTGGTAEVLFEPAPNERFQGPSLLPDGDTVLFSVTESDWESARVVAQSITTGERTVLVEGGSSARYLESGHLIYALDDDLFALAFDPDTLTVSGGAVPVVDGVGRALAPLSGLANYGVTDDGTLVYLAGGTGTDLVAAPVWVDREGREGAAPDVDIDCMCLGPVMSPDGTRIAITQLDAVTADTDIWIWNVLQQTYTRLTFAPGRQLVPVWSPDGQRIAYGSFEGLFAQRADGTGSIERLLDRSALPVAWTADDEILYVFSESPSPFVGDIGVLELDGDPTPRVVLATPFNEQRATLSPDGRWLAYQSDESGRPEIYVRPYPDVESGRWQVSTNGGEDPQWSPDGSTLFFLGPDAMMAAAITGVDSFAFSTPAPLFGVREFNRGYDGHDYAVSMDGNALLLSRYEGFGGADGFELVIVQNWVDELKRLVPVPD
jgi:serine/threonine-protein kinase